MELSQPSLSSLDGLTSKQQEILVKLREVAQTVALQVNIDPEIFELQSPCAVDVEHDEQGNLVCIGIYDGVNNFCFTRVSTELAQELRVSDIIAHNGNGDMDSLRQWGIDVLDVQLVWDTMLIGHIQDSSKGSYGLKDMAARELGISYPSYDEIVGKHKGKTKAKPKCPQNDVGCCNRGTLDKQPLEIVALYNGLDCFVTYKLYEAQKRTLSGTISQYFNEVEKPVSKVFASMEVRGLSVDLAYLEDLKGKLEAQRRPLEEEIRAELGDINLNSPKQLLEALNAKEIYPELKGKPSTDKRALERFKENATVKRLLQFSELETLLSSFVTPYLERKTGIVHPFFSQTGTRTGRPSCSNPNLLQIPKRTENGRIVRNMFVPREGMLFGETDYGQIEPRVLAHFSRDPALCGLFNQGVDFHTYTAERLNISREKAKVLNLSVGYRATFKSVAAQLGGTEDEAQQQINAWWALFPRLRRWQDSIIFESKRSGFCTTLLGRRIQVDNLSHGNTWRREAAERQLINNITQGSAAEIIKKAMINLAKDARLSPTFGLLVQIYDSLLFESEDVVSDSKIVVDNMEKALKLEVPLTVDLKIGPRWGEMKELI